MAIKFLNLKCLCIPLTALLFACAPQLYAKTVYTSTGGTSGSPLSWSNSSTWTSSGTGTPLVYIIRSGDYVDFDANNSSPYVDTVYIYGNLIVSNNKVMTLTGNGVLQLMLSSSKISGGSSNTQFQWNGTGVTLSGPFTSSNIVTNGPRYATAGTVSSAGGNIQNSFVSGILPLYITDFNLYSNEKTLNFQWNSVSERRDAGFKISYSTDLKNWVEIRNINAGADSVSPGKFNITINRSELKNAADKRIYFKLEMFAGMDMIDQSDVIVDHYKKIADKDILNLNITPNPADTDPLVDVYCSIKGTLELTICLQTGEMVKKIVLNFDEEIVEQGVVLRDLAPGPYIVRATISGQNASLKLVRQ